MFTGVNASMCVASPVPPCIQLRRLVTPDSCRLAYTARMHSFRPLHLLIAAAILFSQIVSGIHMAGHVHVDEPLTAFTESPAPAWSAHAADLTDAEHRALHLQDIQHAIASSAESDEHQASLDFSCVIYHIYAGFHGAAAGCVELPAATHVAFAPQTRVSPALLTPIASHNAIRGPPVSS